MMPALLQRKYEGKLKACENYFTQERHVRQDSYSENRRQNVGCICQLGWAVFRHVSGSEYRKEPLTSNLRYWAFDPDLEADSVNTNYS